MDAPIFPLASSAMQLNRSSRDFSNQLNKQLHSRNFSLAVLISPGLLSRSSPKHLSRAWLIVLPHLNNADTGSTLNRSLRSVKLRRPFCQPCHPVCFRAQRAHISRSTGNVVAVGCLAPPRRVSERSVQTLPFGSPFQDVVLTAQLHINPETSLERLEPLEEFWQRGNFCQIHLVGSCRL